jgi:K+ transporter
MSYEDDNNLLEWDKKNITRFAQYLYNLAKEKVLEEKEKATEVIVSEKPIIETENELEAKKIERKIALEEVTIGLAKTVEGEEIPEEVATENLEELQEIIEKEQIPLPVEEITVDSETPLETKPIVTAVKEVIPELESSLIAEEEKTEIGIAEDITIEETS